MNPERFLFMADAHIKGRTWTNSMKLAGDSHSALNKVEDYLLKMDESVRPERLVIGGDWFDSNRPSSIDLLVTSHFLECFREVWYIRGNHDSADPSFLASLSRKGLPVCQLDNRFVEFPGTGALMTGVSWRASADALKERLKQVAEAPEAEGCAVLYLVLHTAFRHLLGFDGSWQLDSGFLDECGFKCPVKALVGDIHKRDLLELPNKSSVYSPGSLYPLSSADFSRSFSVPVFSAADGGFTELCTDVRMYRRVRYGDRRQLSAELEKIRKESADAGMYEPAFVSVELPEDVDTSGLQDALKDVPGVVAQVEADIPGVAQPVVGESAETCITAEQAVRDELSADREVADMAAGLLNADDPAAEIRSWLDYWKVEVVR